ncbi:YceI family protein [Schlegelella sp. S2-27]|uniref:YceI family protein n=1 Tax=Caldimonas mangrovi TaxID=2944811 RepID=A0ABT0YTK8_9BURK|nr:YceI family protein [Caldimonas mangrovi]MCM5681734.1 YceI family protein [Caldimonas mangrovi]
MKPIALLASLLALCGPAARAEPVTYLIEPTHTSITWEVLHFGTSTSRGRFARVQGQVVLDRAARTGEVSVEIDATAMDTGIGPFNARLKAADLLATTEHPKAWFVAGRLRFDGERVSEVPGELTLRGTSAPVSLKAVRFNCYRNPLFGREVCGGDFEATVKRSDFGMSFGLPFVADEVLLRVQVEAVRQAP